MAVLRMIPDTRGGRAYRRFLLVAGIVSIVGIADQIRAFFGLTLWGASARGANVARVLILLAGWGLICWCAV